MKQLIALVLALVCVFALVGCNNSQPEQLEPNFTEKQTATGNNYSDFDGISIQTSGIYIYPDKTTIVINWTNNTEFSAIYGEQYSIERLENDQWVSYLIDDNDLTDINHELRAKESDSKEYILMDTEEVIKPGTYRFLSTCIVKTGEEQSKECSVWVEFIIE